MDAGSEWKLPWEGGCRCGNVRFRVTLPPLVSMACHCTGCQRMSASAFSLSLLLPGAGLEILTGHPVRGGLREGPSKHMFCPDCMSWMFTRTDAPQELVNLRPTLLDDPTWFAPYIETYTSEKLPWAETPAVHAFAKFPEPGDYEGLLREFAAGGARPK
jgi:hypothetical protein